jgi:hypothetical protein
MRHDAMRRANLFQAQNRLQRSREKKELRSRGGIKTSPA